MSRDNNQKYELKLKKKGLYCKGKRSLLKSGVQLKKVKETRREMFSRVSTVNTNKIFI